jgi:hypothetical protein
VTAQDETFLDLAQFLSERLREGDDSKTFLAGRKCGAWMFAIAVGVRGDEDLPRFLEFARYLVHHRFDCDLHALLWPASIAGKVVYAAELAAPGQSLARIIDQRGVTQPHPGGELMIDAITPQHAPLPGIKRRDLDRLFDVLQVPLQSLARRS